MLESLLPLGYGGMFLSAFLAATLLPIGSELLLLALLEQGLAAEWLWLFASVGNVLGSMVNFAIGYWLGEHKLASWQQQRWWLRANRWFNRYGYWSMLLAWLPVVGDPLTLLAGLARLKWYWVLLLVFVGKAGRYAVLVLGWQAM